MADETVLSLVTAAAAAGATHLDLSYRELDSLPPEIGVLAQLTHLDLRGNELSALPPAVGLLRNLEQLDLRHNRITELPIELGRLTKLTRLDLRNNRLTALPSHIGQLGHLRYLDVRENQLQIFPPALLQLSELEELHIWSNPILAVPYKIGRLTGLRTLNLGGSDIDAVPPGIWQLGELEHLMLEHTRISKIPPEIANLRKLKYIELHNNRLTTLPPEIGLLPSLQALVLYNNDLVALPPQIGQLQSLRRLDARQNRITELPVEIARLEKLEVLDLRGNPLPVPPEILSKTQVPSALITYHLEHRSGQRKPLNEAKVVLVGQGSVGKTSLLKRLTAGSYDPRENRTEGIVIQHWQTSVNSTAIRLNVWDFGGQEIMHATHQFFLTKRTLYLLVLDNRLGEEENRLEYWLKIIQSFGGDSPIIVVGNKADQQRLDLDQHGLQAKYPQVRAIISTSCASGDGIDKLKALIAREVMRLPHVRDELLISWFNIKRRLERLDKDYIAYEEYVTVCAEEGVTDEVSQRTLIGFLHDLGIVLNFQGDPRLEDTNILNPEWVTNGVYRILNDGQLLSKRGMLEHADLSRILDPRAYPRHKHRFILDMMRKFELCIAFEGRNGDQYLIPDLLDKEAPQLGNWTDSLAFEYTYNVLPSSIISRFIVRMQPYLQNHTYWRNGAVVADQEATALVVADREDNRISVRVKGTEAARPALLSIIRSHFDAIHHTIPGIQAEERVPLPGRPEIVVDHAYLRDLAAMGERSFVPPGLRQRVEVKPLLEGIDLPPKLKELVRLRQLLAEKFTVEGLQLLCNDLGIDYESLEGEGKAAKARELLAYLDRRERVQHLVDIGMQHRPDLPWEPALSLGE